MYKATQKQQIILGNQIIDADGFGTWEIINYGTNPLTINNTITLKEGEKYKLDLLPNVVFETPIAIKFDTTNNGTSKAAAILIYNKEV